MAFRKSGRVRLLLPAVKKQFFLPVLNLMAGHITQIVEPLPHMPAIFLVLALLSGMRHNYARRHGEFQVDLI
jgi:hypothetical protein